MFDDLDEQGEQLLGSLHLGPAEEEPVRRGAASRANSVRFDESALHGSSWSNQNNRHSGDFGPVRPGSGLMMERSSSHKSDGRHSSAGHSVHSHHSVASGRASSVGLDTNLATADDDDDSFDIPGPPVSFYVLGTVPSIVRCWLTTNFAHGTLLYADVCSGSQKSSIDYALVKELELLDEMHRDVDGVCRIRLSVYLAEAVVTQHAERLRHMDGSVPSITVLFEVTGIELAAADRRTIRIFIGSDALRAHSADILFSKNTMVLYGDDRDRLRVPFVRPEDDAVFRHISTTSVLPEKPKLNANATPFKTVGQQVSRNPEKATADNSAVLPEDDNLHVRKSAQTTTDAPDSDSGHGSDGGRAVGDQSGSEVDVGKGDSTNSDTSRKDPSSGIWGSWRQGSATAAIPEGAQRDSGPRSGYQPAARSVRGMKVLKPPKPSSNSARTGASYEPPLPSKSGGEGRRKSQGSAGGGDHTLNGSSASGITPIGPSHGANGGRWDSKRAVSIGHEAKPVVAVSMTSKGDSRGHATLPRSANPVGVASAFSWMSTPPGGSKPSADTMG